MIQLRTLGALELTSSTGTSLEGVLKQPKRAALLCYVALASRVGFRRRDTLLATFWPELDEDQARHALRQSLYFLRRSLGPGVLVSRGDDELGIGTGVTCDALEFTCAIEDGRLEEALALYQGELLPGFFLSEAPEFERWLEGERSRLRDRAVSSARALVQQRSQEGKLMEAAQWAQRALELSPLDESLAREVIVLLERAGDSVAALRAFETFARNLERDYGLSPSVETRELVARIRARESSTARTPALTHLDVPSSAREPDFVARPEAPSASTVKSRRRLGARRLGAGLVLAFLALGAWRLLGRAHTAPATRLHQRMLIADFADRTNDSTLGDLVTQVLRSELARSPVLSVAGSEAIENALRRMGRDSTTPVGNALAREVAAREQINIVLEGEVRSTAGGFVIDASVIETATGDAIYGASEIAPDSAAILKAVERLADAIRSGIGESLASIRASDSLYSFTTTSLPALRRQTEATRAFLRGDFATARTLLNDAIALDSTFAYAHLLLWATLNNAGLGRRQGIRPLIRAYQLRGRLTDWERYGVEGSYYLNAVGDLPRAIAAFREHLLALQRVSVREAGQYAAFATALVMSGDTVGARALLEDAHAHHPTAVNQTVLARLLYSSGDEAGAARVLNEALRRYPDHPLVLSALARLLGNAGRYDEGHALAARIRRDAGLLNGLWLEAELDAIRGRYNETLAHLRSLEEENRLRGDAASEIELSTAIAQLRLAAGDSLASSELTRVFVRHQLDSLDVLSRPYVPLARFYAAAGKARIGWEMLRTYEHEFPAAYRAPDQWLLSRARASLYDAEGKLPLALGALLQASHAPPIHVGLYDDSGIPQSADPMTARLYDRLGVRDSAIAVYERYLAVRSLDRSAMDALELGRSLERLARLCEQRGDSAKAAVYYHRLSLLWQTGDSSWKARASAAERSAVRLHLPELSRER